MGQVAADDDKSRFETIDVLDRTIDQCDLLLKPFVLCEKTVLSVSELQKEKGLAPFAFMRVIKALEFPLLSAGETRRIVCSWFATKREWATESKETDCRDSKAHEIALFVKARCGGRREALEWARITQIQRRVQHPTA